MQHFAEHNPMKWLRNRGQLTQRQEVKKGIRWCKTSLLKTAKGAGAKFGADSHSREGKTDTSQHSNSKKVQNSPGDRRNLVGGHGRSVVLEAAP